MYGLINTVTEWAGLAGLNNVDDGSCIYRARKGREHV